MTAVGAVSSIERSVGCVASQRRRGPGDESRLVLNRLGHVGLFRTPALRAMSVRVFVTFVVANLSSPPRPRVDFVVPPGRCESEPIDLRAVTTDCVRWLCDFATSRQEGCLLPHTHPSLSLVYLRGLIVGSASVRLGRAGGSLIVLG